MKYHLKPKSSLSVLKEEENSSDKNQESTMAILCQSLLEKNIQLQSLNSNKEACHCTLSQSMNIIKQNRVIRSFSSETWSFKLPRETDPEGNDRLIEENKELMHLVQNLDLVISPGRADTLCQNF